jgi:hypothetical protein
MQNYIAQALGILALIIMVLSYQQRTRNRLLMLQIAANLLLASNYYLIGAFTGCVMCLISVARSFVFSKSHTRWGKSRLWFYGFLIISVVAGALTWGNFYSIFALAATLLLTVALYSQDTKRMRLLLLFCPPLYFVYNFVNHSIGGMGSDIFCFISALIAVWRFDIRKADKKEDRAKPGEISADESVKKV